MLAQRPFSLLSAQEINDAFYKEFRLLRTGLAAGAAPRVVETIGKSTKKGTKKRAAPVSRVYEKATKKPKGGGKKKGKGGRGEDIRCGKLRAGGAKPFA